MHPFSAKYHGLCLSCDEDIKPGESIVSHPDAGFIHEECIEDVGSVRESNGADFDSFTWGRAPIAVLPRGKTSKDRCGKCFQVPASNGVCGCE